MNTKSDIRLWAKNIRKSLNMREISLLISDRVRSLDCYKSAEHVLIFYPLEHEVNLLSLLDGDKQFYLPRVKGSRIEVCPYAKGDELKPSEFKVLEPVNDSVSPNVPDLVLIPALAVDNNFNRLGYGGGYYDRFLDGISALKLVVIPDELVVDNLPVEEFDKQCDGFITQKKASFLRG